MTDRARYMGVISLFAGNFTPSGVLRCDGQALSVRDFPGLASVIGTAFGGNDTTFHLPNLNASLPFPGGREPAYVICADGVLQATGRRLDRATVIDSGGMWPSPDARAGSTRTKLIGT